MSLMTSSRDARMPLHLAAESGDLKFTKKLIQKGHSVNGRDGADRTPLYLAVSRVQLGVVNELLNWGADCNAQNRRGNTPLHKAVELGSHKMVQVLLHHGANPLVRNGHGRRPIEAATSTKIRLLLRSNVIHSESEQEDDDNDNDDIMQVTTASCDDYVTVDLTETSAGEECDVVATSRQQSSRERLADLFTADQRSIKDEPLALTPPPDVVYSNLVDRKTCEESKSQSFHYEAVNNAHSRQHPLKLKIKVRRCDNIFASFGYRNATPTATDMTSSSPINDALTGVVMTSSAVASPMSVNDDDNIDVQQEMTPDEVVERSSIVGSLTSVPVGITDRLHLAGYEVEDISDPEEDNVPMVMGCAYSLPNIVWPCHTAIGSSAGVTGSVDRTDDHLDVVSKLCTVTSEIETRIGSSSSQVFPMTVALLEPNNHPVEAVSTRVSNDVTVDDESASDCPPELELVLGLKSTPDGIIDESMALTSPGLPSSVQREQSPQMETAVDVLDNVDSFTTHENIADDDSSSPRIAELAETPEITHCKDVSPSLCVTLTDDIMTSVEEVTGAVVSVVDTTKRSVKRRRSKQIPSWKIHPQRQYSDNESPNHIEKMYRNLKKLTIRLRRLDDQPQLEGSLVTNTSPPDAQEKNDHQLHDVDKKRDVVDTCAPCRHNSETTCTVTCDDNVAIDDVTSHATCDERNAATKRLPTNPFNTYLSVKKQIMDNQELLVRQWNEMERLLDWTRTCPVTNCVSYTRSYQLHDDTMSSKLTGDGNERDVESECNESVDCTPDLKKPCSSVYDVEEQLRQLESRHLQEQIRLVIFAEHELIRAHCQRLDDVTSRTRLPISACVKLMMANDVARGRQSDIINNRCVRHPVPVSRITEIKEKIKRLKDDLLCRQRHEAEVLSAAQRLESRVEQPVQSVHPRRRRVNWHRACDDHTAPLTSSLSSSSSSSTTYATREQQRMFNVSVPLVDISGILDL